MSFTIDSLRIHWEQPIPLGGGFYTTTTCKLESTRKDIPGWLVVKMKINIVQAAAKYKLTLDSIKLDASNFIFRNDDGLVHLFAGSEIDSVNAMMRALTAGYFSLP